MKNVLGQLFADGKKIGFSYVSSSSLLALGLCAALTSLGLPSSAFAASATWTGGADGLQTNLNDNLNWSTGSAAFVSGDVITFDNATPLGKTLIWNAQLGPGFGATDGLHVNYTGAGNLTLDSNPSSALFGIGNITIASGAGVFTVGEGAAGATLVYRGANNQSTFTNNSSNRAVFAADVLWRAGGGAAKTVTIDGTGDWLYSSAFRIDPSQGQSGLTLVKNGAGALQLAAPDNFGGSAGAITLNQGSLTISNNGSLGTGGNFAQPIALNGGTFAFASSANQTISGVISGSAPFNQSAGNLTLTGANTYGGALTLNGGSLTLSGNGTLNSASSVVVDGASARLTNSTASAVSVPVSLRAGTLSGAGGFGSVVVPNQTGKVVSLGMSGAETVTVGSLAFQGAAELNVTKAGDPATASVTVSGALSTTPASGKIKLSSSLPFWTSAQFYNLVQAGSLSGSAASFEIGTISGLTSRQSASVSVQGTSVGIMINGDSPRWTGAGNAVWDTSSTGNWALMIGGGSTTFINGDVVRFDDTAANASVGIGASGVQPSTVQFENNTLDYTLAGPGGITAGSVIKSGAARLTVSAVNSYAGGTTINGGTLALSGAGTLGGSSANVTLNGGTLDLGAATRSFGTVSVAGESSVVNGDLAAVELRGAGTSGNSTVSARVTGSGSVRMNGAGGTLILSAANTYTGGTTVNAGTLALSGNGTLGSTSANATVSGGVLDLGGSTQTLGLLTLSGAGTVQNGTLHNTPVVGALGSGTAVVAAPITGTAGVSSTVGGGILALAGANTYTGATTVNAGTLQVGNGGETGSISPASPITVAAGANFAVSRSNAATQGVDFGAITGAGGFTKSGTGATTLNQANTYTGNTTILGGTLAVTAAGALGTGPVNINGFGNRLHLSGGVTLPNLINTGGGVTVQNVSGNNTLSGAFEFGNVGAVNTWITSSADTLTLAGNLTISTNLNWTTANRTFTFNGAGNTTVSGAIHNGPNALIGVSKEGGGVLTLSGVSDYTRPTMIYGGVLRLDGSLVTNTTAAAASQVVVELDGTLAGTGSIAGSTEVYGMLRPSAGGQPGGSLRFDGPLYIDGFSRTQFDVAGALFTGVNSTASSGLTYGGTLRLNFTSGIYNGTYQLFQINGAPNGDFVQVTLTTTNAGETDLALTRDASAWRLTSGAVTYAFEPSTGVLSVTGGLDAVVPGSATLSATAGDGSVGLSWTAASNADSYVIRRSTIAGGPYTTLVNGAVGTSYTDTAVTNGTTYYYVVVGKDSASGLTGAASAEVSATPQAAPYSALQTWRFDTFGVHDDDGTVLAGDAEDYDGDGLANLLEYALGTDAKVANASPVTVAKSGDFLTLSYPRRSPADASLSYVVQGSNDLTSFTAGAGSTVENGSVSTYTDTVNVNAAGVRRFLRLSVSYQAPAQP